MSLSFEVLDNRDGSKSKKKFAKMNRIKVKLGIGEVAKVIESSGDFESLSGLVEYYIQNSDEVEGRIWLLAALGTGADLSADSSRIFNGVSHPRSPGQLDVTCSVKCDVLDAVVVFVSEDESDERLFLDYGTKAGIMLGINGTGGMKCAKAVKVERSQLLRARVVLDYDVRNNSYIASRSNDD